MLDIDFSDLFIKLLVGLLASGLLWKWYNALRKQYKAMKENTRTIVVNEAMLYKWAAIVVGSFTGVAVMLAVVSYWILTIVIANTIGSEGTIKQVAIHQKLDHELLVKVAQKRRNTHTTMTNYNSSEMTTWLNSRTASDLTVFAGDLASNWMGAFTSRFTLSARDSDSLNQVPTWDRTALIAGLNATAAKMGAGAVIDGLWSITDTAPSAGTPVARGHWTLHTDTVWIMMVPCLASCWVTHDKG